jgi:hypothetical protein
MMPLVAQKPHELRRRSQASFHESGFCDPQRILLLDMRDKIASLK